MAAVSSSRQRGGEGTSWEHRRNKSEDHKQNFSLPYQVPSPPQSPSNQDEFMSSGNQALPGRNMQSEFDHYNGNIPDNSQYQRGYQQRVTGRGAPQSSDYIGSTAFSRMRQPSQPEGRQERSYNAPSTSRYMKKGNLVRSRDDDSNWVHRDKLIALEIQDHIDRGERVPQALLDAQAQAVSGETYHPNHQDAQYDLTENNLHQLATGAPSGDVMEEEEQYVPEDPRTPEEIAADTKPSSGSAYYSPGNRSGTSRIPVSKSGTRSRSQSVGSQVLLDEIDPPSTPPSPNHQRQGSKTHSRKVSGAGRSLKSRAASAGAGSASRPTTGDSPPRGAYSTDVQAPWLDEMYKPDPLLPPDQQVLPTHAKRLHQEQMAREAAERQREQEKIERERQRELERERDRIERENDREMRRKASAERAAAEKAHEEQANAMQHDPRAEQEPYFAEKPQPPSKAPKPLAPFPERFDPFKPSGPSVATPTSEHGGYRTMPKVQGTPTSPAPNLRTQQPIHVQDPEAAAQKKGCGCCVVM